MESAIACDVTAAATDVIAEPWAVVAAATAVMADPCAVLAAATAVIADAAAVYALATADATLALRATMLNISTQSPAARSVAQVPEVLAMAQV